MKKKRFDEEFEKEINYWKREANEGYHIVSELQADIKELQEEHEKEIKELKEEINFRKDERDHWKGLYQEWHNGNIGQQEEIQKLKEEISKWKGRYENHCRQYMDLRKSCDMEIEKYEKKIQKIWERVDRILEKLPHKIDEEYEAHKIPSDDFYSGMLACLEKFESDYQKIKKSLKSKPHWSWFEREKKRR